MAITIVATPGATDANSYCTKAEADTYHTGHLYGSAWEDADTDTKNRALVSATRLLDEHIEWDGHVTVQTQALLWPRAGMYYENSWYIDGSVVPQKLKEAVAEFARLLIVEDRTAENDIAAQGITAIAAGAVNLTFNGRTRAKVIPDSVYYMIRNWGEVRSRTGTTVRLMRS
jgi:hypothetical protein